MQVAGMLPKKERKIKKEKEKETLPEGKLKFSERLKILLTKENGESCNDDTFNSDDPYAFPDTVSETDNCVIGFSATPILRNAWNSSQKCSPDISTLDSPSRSEPAIKSLPTTDNKLKTNSPTLSKTMNRLHAKIAQNKLLDKQKKTQDASQCIVTLNPQLNIIGTIKSNPSSPIDISSITSESSEPDSKITSVLPKDNLLVKLESNEDQARSEDSLVSNYIPSPNPPSVMQVDSRLSSGVASYESSEKNFGDAEKSSTPSDFNSRGKLHFNIKLEKTESKKASKIPVAFRKLQRLFQKRKKDNYIFPRGFDSSESESSDNEEDHFYNQLTRFCLWDGRNLCSTNGSLPRSIQQENLKSELSKSYYQLCRLRSLHKQEQKRHQEVIQPLIDSARAYPNLTTEILMKRTISSSVNQNKNDKPPFSPKTTCCYEKDEIPCSNVVLPYTWHCKKHIMYNVNQLLFEHCTAKFSNNTQCCVPVFDVCHELPLCFEHAKKRDNYNKMASEPKAKKARKKPKPSALTRPPKRGKKKKKVVRPTTPTLPPPPPSIALPTASVSSLSPVPIKNETVSDMPNINTFTNEPAKAAEPIITTAPDLNKNMNDGLSPELESDLEDFSPGAIEKTLELPLDTAELANQATKLLEEHDFTEVLNKIPDDAFNDLFVDTRNGEYIPSREETEELERALAAVSKDVHLARESLAKLSSSSGPDLEELERAIEIHGGLLGADNLTSAIDENSFVGLSSNHMDNLNHMAMPNSFSTSDLNSLSRALSEISAVNLDQNNITMVSEASLLPNSINVPLITSEMSHPHMLNGQTEMIPDLHSIQLDPAYSSNIINPTSNMSFTSGGSQQGTVDSKLFSNGSLLSTLYYNLASSNTPSASAQMFNVPPVSGSNTSEEANFMSSSGGVNNPNHWLLNSPDVLALSQLNYPNNFLTSQGSVSIPYANAFIGKYPLQDLNADIGLGSTDSSMLATSNCNVENVICGTNEQPVHHNLSIANRSTTSLQQPRSVKVIVQEGAS